MASDESTNESTNGKMDEDSYLLKNSNSYPRDLTGGSGFSDVTNELKPLDESEIEGVGVQSLIEDIRCPPTWDYLETRVCSEPEGVKEFRHETPQPGSHEAPENKLKTKLTENPDISLVMKEFLLQEGQGSSTFDYTDKNVTPIESLKESKTHQTSEEAMNALSEELGGQTTSDRAITEDLKANESDNSNTGDAEDNVPPTDTERNALYNIVEASEDESEEKSMKFGNKNNGTTKMWGHTNSLEEENLGENELINDNVDDKKGKFTNELNSSERIGDIKSEETINEPANVLSCVIFEDKTKSSEDLSIVEPPTKDESQDSIEQEVKRFLMPIFAESLTIGESKDENTNEIPFFLEAEGTTIDKNISELSPNEDVHWDITREDENISSDLKSSHKLLSHSDNFYKDPLIISELINEPVVNRIALEEQIDISTNQDNEDNQNSKVQEGIKGSVDLTSPDVQSKLLAAPENQSCIQYEDMIDKMYRSYYEELFITTEDLKHELKSEECIDSTNKLSSPKVSLEKFHNEGAYQENKNLSSLTRDESGETDHSRLEKIIGNFGSVQQEMDDYRDVSIHQEEISQLPIDERESSSASAIDDHSKEKIDSLTGQMCSSKISEVIITVKLDTSKENSSNLTTLREELEAANNSVLENLTTIKNILVENDITQSEKQFESTIITEEPLTESEEVLNKLKSKANQSNSSLSISEVKPPLKTSTDELLAQDEAIFEGRTPSILPETLAQCVIFEKPLTLAESSILPNRSPSRSKIIVEGTVFQIELEKETELIDTSEKEMEFDDNLKGIEQNDEKTIDMLVRNTFPQEEDKIYCATSLSGRQNEALAMEYVKEYETSRELNIFKIDDCSSKPIENRSISNCLNVEVEIETKEIDEKDIMKAEENAVHNDIDDDPPNAIYICGDPERKIEDISIHSLQAKCHASAIVNADLTLIQHTEDELEEASDAESAPYYECDTSQEQTKLVQMKNRSKTSTPSEKNIQSIYGINMGTSKEISSGKQSRGVTGVRKLDKKASKKSRCTIS